MASVLDSGAQDIVLARQPIFDRTGRVYGYELLYRGGPLAEAAAGPGRRQMAIQTVVESVLGPGLLDLAEGRYAFINIPSELLVEGVPDLLSPRTVVLEILEDTVVTDEVTDACLRLRERGFTLALDDYLPGDAREPLLPHVQMVKVDVVETPADALAGLVAQLRPRGVRLVAEKVEDHAGFTRCADLGFDLFQGYYFRRPQAVVRRDISASHAAIVHLFNRLSDPDASRSSVVEAVQGDVALSCKLLGMANAAGTGVSGIRSIPHALDILGLGPLRRWVLLLLAASAGEQAPTAREATHEMLVRARFCETVAAGLPGVAPEEAFLAGLLSRLDALLGVERDALLGRLRLATTVREALTGSGPLVPVLALADAIEAADAEAAWTLARTLGLTAVTTSRAYFDAVAWMRESVASL